MNIRHLAIFHAVANSGSISHAATKIHISQPAISKQLSELEHRQGVTLFDRFPRGMRLTEAGRCLKAYADQIFLLESEAERALEALQGLDAGNLRIGASTTIGNYLLPEVFDDFHQRYPNVELDLEVENTQSVQARVLSGDLDIGFTEGLVDISELEVEVFFTDQLIPVAAADHPLLDEGTVTVDRLCRQPMLVRESGSGTLAVTRAALTHLDASPHVVMTLGSTEAIKRALYLNDYVAVVSWLAVRTELNQGLLRPIPVKDLDIKRPLHQLHLHHRHPTAAVSAFLNLLNNHIRQPG